MSCPAGMKTFSPVIPGAAKNPVIRVRSARSCAPLGLICRGLFVALTTALSAAELPADRFEYDKSASLAVQEAGRETRGAALVRDVTFAARDKTVKAYLVTPATVAKPGAAILYVHWLGEPETTNRTQFLDEAVAFAGQGVTSLLIDAMWSEPKWFKNRIPEEDVSQAVQQVIEIRRAMDLLLEQPGVDAKRVAFVGHDFGAMYGILASALDPRAKTYVFMAGTPHFIDWFLFAAQPKDLASYKEQLAAIDPVNAVAKLAPARIFFQFGSKDFYVSAEEAAEFYAAARPPKYLATYETEHPMHAPEVAADRVAWLRRELGIR
jgi:dienelactone hydrolase